MIRQVEHGQTSRKGEELITLNVKLPNAGLQRSSDQLVQGAVAHPDLIPTWQAAAQMISCRPEIDWSAVEVDMLWPVSATVTRTPWRRAECAVATHIAHEVVEYVADIAFVADKRQLTAML